MKDISQKGIRRRGIKTLKDVYAEIKVGVTYYVTFSSSTWIKEEWK